MVKIQDKNNLPGVHLCTRAEYLKRIVSGSRMRCSVSSPPTTHVQSSVLSQVALSFLYHYSNLPGLQCIIYLNLEKKFRNLHEKIE